MESQIIFDVESSNRQRQQSRSRRHPGQAAMKAKYISPEQATTPPDHQHAPAALLMKQEREQEEQDEKGARIEQLARFSSPRTGVTMAELLCSISPSGTPLFRHFSNLDRKACTASACSSTPSPFGRNRSAPGPLGRQYNDLWSRRKSVRTVQGPE